jgi:hypothetical protein
MVSAVEKARLDFIRRNERRKRKFAGLGVSDAIKEHNKTVDGAFKAAKLGKVISLTDLMVSKEQLTEKVRKEGLPTRQIGVDELMKMPLSKIKRLKAQGLLRGV